MYEADANALQIYAQAGCDPEDPPGPVLLAAAIGLRIVWRAGIRGARLRRETLEILVSSRLSPVALAWAVAHEIAEWHLGRIGYDDADREQASDALAAALILPIPAYRRATAAFGGTVVALPDISHAFRTSQSIAALRMGEVTGRPLALVTPSRVHLRGDEWGWPPEDGIRLLAQHVDTTAVERWRLSDAPRRVLLVAA